MRELAVQSSWFRGNNNCSSNRFDWFNCSHLGARYNVDALSILTVSDHVITGEETTAEERQTTFNDMIKVALETLINE